MTGTELDDILADNGTQETEQTVETAVARDDQGRFAAKAEEPAVVEQPAVVEAEHAEGNIPPAALAASRQKAREKEQEAETLRREMAELRGQIQVLSQRPQAPQPKAEEKPKPDFWDDPNGFVQTALNPVQQQMQQQREQFSKMLATQAHGKEKVDAAYQAIAEHLQTRNPAAQADYQSIMADEHPYNALVDWHARQQTLRTVGNDPNAWLEAEMEKRLADPEYQAKVLERIRGTAAQNTSRSNPVTNLPPSLTRLPAGGNAPAQADMSDAGLFSNALR